VVAKADDKKILLQVPNEPRPSLLGRDQFVSICSPLRHLVVHGRHLKAPPHIHRGAGCLVLPADLRPVSSLMFQVVIDKVLVHHSMSTLDVLAIGLAGIEVFECLLTILRT
jgi:subfamily B ATP-binding cassette protein HlyB/CyaB